MKTCAASSCDNTSYNSPYLTWHPLPLDSYLRDDWTELLGIPDDDEDVEPPKVCSTHFKPSDFLSNNRTLKMGARPSLRLAKTARPHRKDKTDMEDYIASGGESEGDVSVVPTEIEPKSPEEAPRSNARPSRKAAQKAAEKMKKYCYLSPPGSPESPSEERPSTSRHHQRPSTSGYTKKIVLDRNVPVPIRPTYPAINLIPMSTVTTLPTFVKFPSPYSPINTVRSGVNVTHVPVKPATEEIPVTRHTLFDKTGVNMTLQMECYEELLTPAQVSRHQKMEADAAQFNQTLRTLRASSVTIIHHTDPFVRVTNTVTMVSSQMTNGVGGNSFGTSTTDVLKSTPSTGMVIPKRGPTTTIIRPPPPVVLAPGSQPIQVIGAAGQPAIILSPTVVGGQKTLNLTPTPVTQQLSYKVLVDSRTGIVVGTVPQPIATVPVTTQSVPILTAAPKMTSKAIPLVVPSLQSSLPVEPVIPDTIEELDAKESEENIPSCDLTSEFSIFTLEGKDTEVSAESLLHIKAVSGNIHKWNKMLAQIKPILQAELEKENFFTDPLRWMLKMNLVVAESHCKSCTQGKYCLVPDANATDGFKWLCNKARCAKMLPVQRLFFFSRFGCSLNRLLPLVFHWAVQTEIHEVKNLLKVDTYVIRSVWRALQEVCTRAIVIKAKKLGGPGKVVEVVTSKLGTGFWVLAAMERKSGHIRLKVVRSETDWNSFTNLQKILEPWLAYKSVVMSPEPTLKGLGRLGFVFTLVEKKNNSTDPEALIHVFNVSKYVISHLNRMFGTFKLHQLKLDTIQGFLDELQWRNRYGRSPRDSFCYIFKDIAEQSGRMVSFPVSDFVPGAAASKGQDPPEVTISSDSDNSSNDSEDNSTINETPAAPSTSATEAIKKPVIKTYASTAKVVSTTTSSSSSSSNSTTSKQKGSTDSSFTVVLDSYYYAVKKGDVTDLAETDPKGNFQFKCIVCKKVIDNNLKVMKHMIGHIEENRNRNPDLSDLTQCKYCFRDFDTPFSMQCHMENAHLNTNALSCQICNQAFTTTKDLAWHMRWIHIKAEMPYSCQVCNYRSSFHRDVLDHFQLIHNNTDKLLCHYCLRVYSARFSGPDHLGHLQNFYYHLYKHQGKTTTKKCSSCCLVFPTPNDVKKHKLTDHVSFAKDKSIIYGTPKTGQDIIYVKDPHMREISATGPPKKRGGRSKRGKSEDDDDSNSYQNVEEQDPLRSANNLASLVLPVEYNKFHCVECKNKIDPEHFVKCVSCSWCKYSTFCSKAFVEHMISVHSQLDRKRPSLFYFKPPILDKPLFCPCGFQSKQGNILANHLQVCNRKTCFSDWMRAVSSLVKLEPGSEGSAPREQGSAFFPPLIVLDENEEDYVNQTLSAIPEPEPGVKTGVVTRKKRARESSEQAAALESAKEESVKESPPKKKACEGEPPSWLNALGLVRRPGGASEPAVPKLEISTTNPDQSKGSEEAAKDESAPKLDLIPPVQIKKDPDEQSGDKAEDSGNVPTSSTVSESVKMELEEPASASS